MQAIKNLPSTLFSFVTKSLQLHSVRQTSSSQPSEYISANLANGVGRYVCQLQRLTFKFCKEHPSSRGIREFIENDLIDFAKKNPGVVVYIQPKRHRIPKLYAEYLNGQHQSLDVAQFTREKINRWIEFMRTRKGDHLVRLLKKQQTHNPSVQGVWNPFTNKNISIATESFPSKSFDSKLVAEKSATEKLIELAKNNQ